ncbi:MAG: hypothetical protein ACM33T_06155 [Solirubrobacterales bacterium]
MNWLLFPAVCVALAACSGGYTPPAPGQAPGWPQPEVPRSHMAIPLPYTNTYLPPGQVQQMPAVAPGENPPYAVRGGVVGAPTPTGGPAAAAGQPACHAVPTVTVEGKSASTVCPNPDGSWSYIAD